MTEKSEEDTQKFNALFKILEEEDELIDINAIRMGNLSTKRVTYFLSLIH